MTTNKLFTVAGAALLALTLTACSEPEITTEKAEPAQEPQTEQAAPETAPEAEEQAPATTEVLSVGDSATIDGQKITLNGVRKSAGEEFASPENDYFLIFDVTVENGTDETLNVSSMMTYQLVDPDGRSQEYTIMPEMNGQLDGTVSPGRKLTGEIGFDVTDAESFDFMYADPFTGAEVIWAINPAEVTE